VRIKIPSKMLLYFLLNESCKIELETAKAIKFLFWSHFSPQLKLWANDASGKQLAHDSVVGNKFS